MQQMSPVQVREWLDAAAAGKAATPFLLDVREPWEFDTCHIAGSVSLPMHLVATRLA